MRLVIELPRFVDYLTAQRYPVIVPPAPIDADALPAGAIVHQGASGAFQIWTVGS